MAKQNRNRTPQAQAPAEPVAPPTDPAAEANPSVVGEGQDDPLAGLSDEGNEAFVDTLLGQARDLDDEKTALYKKIDANRTTLRTVQTTGLLSEKQSKAIDLFYPKRQVKKDTETATA